MKLISRLFLLIVSLSCSVFLFAQDKHESTIGTTMRSNGRIYVVITVILVILAGLIIYLARLDRKIKKLERDS